MRRTEEGSLRHRSDDLFLGGATLVFVFLALQSSGWPALVFAILAVGFASGVVAGVAFDSQSSPVAPASPVRHHQRRAA